MLDFCAPYMYCMCPVSMAIVCFVFWPMFGPCHISTHIINVENRGWKILRRMKIVQFVLNLFLPSTPKMDEPLSNSIVNLTGIPSGTLQDIAYKVVEDQINSNTINTVNITQERTIFVLGSKGVVSPITIAISRIY